MTAVSTTRPTVAPRTRPIHIALRWMISFAGFPLGAVAARAVAGPIDDTRAALIGGAISGAVLGAAQSLVILTAGIDLSVGAIMVLSSVVMGQFTFRYGLPAELSILCGLAVGAFCGFINGILVSRMRLPPFIVTLGMWQIVLATNFLYSANETIRAQDIAQQAPILLLDEPTNHLDIGHQIGLLQLVREQGLTVAAALHDLNHAAMFCDRIAVMQAGRIVALGTPAKVLEPQRLADVFGVTVDVELDSDGGCFIRYRPPEPRPPRLKLVASEGK